jgi:hypothetical protein
MRHTTATLVTAAVATIGMAQAANASVMHGLDIVVRSPSSTWVMSSNPDSYTQTVNEDGSVTLSGSWSPSGAGWAAAWSLNFGVPSEERGAPSAAITSSFTITNTGAGAQNFQVQAFLPIAVPFTATGIRGSYSASLTDDPATANGATVATQPGEALYAALIDNAVVRTLYSDPFAVSASGGLTAAVPTSSYGVPGFEAGPGATINIGIRNRFNLTAGDSVNMTSTLIVIPTPAGASVLALAGLVALRRRR